MKNSLIYLLLVVTSSINCNNKDDMNNSNNNEIIGYQLLTDLKGHWVGSNETANLNPPQTKWLHSRPSPLDNNL